MCDRDVSMKKQGARKHDVKTDTLKKRLLDFPGQFLLVQGDRLYCGACSTNVGSCKSDTRHHCKTIHHTTKVQHKIAGSQRYITKVLVEDIQVVWAPWDSSSDWDDENRSHQVPDSCWLHQVIRGKEGYQQEGHVRLIWLVEVKLCNTTSIVDESQYMKLTFGCMRTASYLHQITPVMCPFESNLASVILTLMWYRYWNTHLSRFASTSSTNVTYIDFILLISLTGSLEKSSITDQMSFLTPSSVFLYNVLCPLERMWSEFVHENCSVTTSVLWGQF